MIFSETLWCPNYVAGESDKTHISETIWAIAYTFEFLKNWLPFLVEAQWIKTNKKYLNP